MAAKHSEKSEKLSWFPWLLPTAAENGLNQGIVPSQTSLTALNQRWSDQILELTIL